MTDAWGEKEEIGGFCETQNWISLVLTVLIFDCYQWQQKILKTLQAW